MPAIALNSTYRFYSRINAATRHCRIIPQASELDDPPPPVPPNDDEEPTDPDDLELPCTDESHWDVFIADDDERDPLPELGDFWFDPPDPE